MILGATYRDKITGFIGVATGCVTYISGCNQVLLNPKIGADGLMREAQWFDQQRLEVLEFEAVIKLDNGDTPGCCAPAPIR